MEFLRLLQEFGKLRGLEKMVQGGIVRDLGSAFRDDGVETGRRGGNGLDEVVEGGVAAANRVDKAGFPFGLKALLESNVGLAALLGGGFSVGIKGLADDLVGGNGGGGEGTGRGCGCCSGVVSRLIGEAEEWCISVATNRRRRRSAGPTRKKRETWMPWRRGGRSENSGGLATRSGSLLAGRGKTDENDVPRRYRSRYPRRLKAVEAEKNRVFTTTACGYQRLYTKKPQLPPLSPTLPGCVPFPDTHRIQQPCRS